MKTKHFICENPTEGQGVTAWIGDTQVTLIAENRASLHAALSDLQALHLMKKAEHLFHCPAARVSPAKKTTED